MYKGFVPENPDTNAAPLTMRIEISLPRAQRRRMQTMLRKSKSRVEALRCRIMLLLHERAPVVEVAQMVGCVRATVYRTLYRFEALDETSLVDRRTTRGTEKVTTQMEEQLLSYLDAVPPDYGWQRSSWSLELLSRQLEDGCGVTLSCSTIYRVLVSQGCRRGRPRPGLRIPVRGRRQILEKVAKRVASGSSREEVFYQDEADLHLNPKIGTTDIKRGQQPGVLTPGKNLKRYIFGALNARTGPIVSGVVEYKNAAMFVEFFKYLSTTYRRARRLHLVPDNYIIHKAGVVKRYLESTNRRFVLHLLPPYSPNHNVIERLWKQMHDHVTRNHRHRHIDTLVAAARCFLHTAQPFPGTKVSTLRAA